MQTKKLRKTIVQLVIFSLILILGVTTAEAQQKYQIAGKQTLAFTKQERSMVGDIESHMLSLVEAEGVNLSTGTIEFFSGAQVINIIASDLVDFSGPVQGYSISKKGNDSLYAKLEGRITTSMSSEGSPLTTIEAKMTWLKGTGRYENIQGNGTAKGRYIASNIYTVDWEGEYWIKK
jgi:hypothetical protein